ncbi:AMP-binding protein [Stappia sp.]|uniref:AMP-binding protein n=1 Tax=Stappia sp. TaxID=1870903 RepID=UPI0032D93C92
MTVTVVGGTLWHHAATADNAIALDDGERSVTWGALAARVEAEAARSMAGAGARVAIATTQAPAETLIRILAAATGGQVAVVFDPSQQTLDPDRLSQRLGCVRVGEDPRPRGQAPSGAREASAVDGPQGADRPFYIGLTSGSTGAPKAFQRSHGSWISSFAVCEHAFGLSAADRVFVPGSLGHSLHLFGAIHAVHLGARLDVAGRFHPRRVVRRMADAATTVLYATPTQLQMIVDAARRGDIALPALRRILVSGAKWQGGDARVAQACPNAELHEFYGTSETSFVTARRPGDPAGSVGRPLPGVDIAVRDADGQPVPAGRAGTIWVRSAMLFDRYVMGEEPETRREGAWLTVGDRGWIGADGALHLAGRASRMLVTSGINVYAEEIESVLTAHPAVAQAAAFGRPDPLRGQEIVAVVQPVADRAPSDALASDVLRHCRDRLAPAKVPRVLTCLAQWPLTPGGKTDLAALRARLDKEAMADDGPGLSGRGAA